MLISNRGRESAGKRAREFDCIGIAVIPIRTFEEGLELRKLMQPACNLLSNLWHFSLKFLICFLIQLSEFQRLINTFFKSLKNVFITVRKHLRCKHFNVDIKNIKDKNTLLPRRNDYSDIVMGNILIVIYDLLYFSSKYAWFYSELIIINNSPN